MQRILMALILALLPTLALAGLDKPLMPGAKVAFLGMTFIDLSTEGAYNGVRADETARLKLLEGAARHRFVAEGLQSRSIDKPGAARRALRRGAARSCGRHPLEHRRQLAARPSLHPK